MTTKVKLTSIPVKVVESENWALLTSQSKQDFKIHIGATVANKDDYHEVRDIGFGVGVTIWAWSDTSTPVTIVVSQG